MKDAVAVEVAVEVVDVVMANAVRAEEAVASEVNAVRVEEAVVPPLKVVLPQPPNE